MSWLMANGLKMVLFDAPMGDWERGDRGLAAVPGRTQQFRDSLPRVLEYAAALDCTTVHVMAGVVGSGDAYERAERVYIENLDHAAGFLGEHGIAAVRQPRHNRRKRVHDPPDTRTWASRRHARSH